MGNAVYYPKYLELDTILNSQKPLSAGADGSMAHDEMLFIIVHQTAELWFRQIIFEIDSVIKIFSRKDENGNRVIDDNAADLQGAVHRLRRVHEIIKLLNFQLTVLETMKPLGFLEFRGYLGAASGFQSSQFRSIEAMLGLKSEHRYHSASYPNSYYRHTDKGGLEKKDVESLRDTEREISLLTLLVEWLERMPFLENDKWADLKVSAPKHRHGFWDSYRQELLLLLGEKDADKIGGFDEMLFGAGGKIFTTAALRSALFIFLYGDKPILRLPSEFLHVLLDVEEEISMWRFRHLLIVKRMLGMKTGTGNTKLAGSADDKKEAGYLEGVLMTNQIFGDLTELATYFIERRKLPELPAELFQDMSFGAAK